jgi:hypothetical protein
MIYVVNYILVLEFLLLEDTFSLGRPLDITYFYIQIDIQLARFHWGENQPMRPYPIV